MRINAGISSPSPLATGAGASVSAAGRTAVRGGRFVAEDAEDDVLAGRSVARSVAEREADEDFRDVLRSDFGFSAISSTLILS
jgi:hypothetical protein